MVAFGTSGLRGLATDLVAGPGYRHAAAFAACLLADGRVAPGGRVAIGMDRRDSSPELTLQAMHALEKAGLSPIFFGILPTPALALHAETLGAPALMVTGSHIPADRNGLKFYRPDGEIDKADEAAIGQAAKAVEFPGREAAGDKLPPANDAAARRYLERYRNAFPNGMLQGLRIGIYRHSSVAADILVDLVSGFGAEIVELGGSDGFVAVDTEAVDPGTADRLLDWSRRHRLDAIVSTDGDGDRPLVVDEAGVIIRGDALGAVAARFLKADMVVTPVSSNPGIGPNLGFEVIRTRIGSPYVIEGMTEAARRGGRCVVGFEANGGVLLGTVATIGTARLAALPTRDSLLPMLAALAAARQDGLTLSRLVESLHLPVCLSGRIENFPRADSDRLMGWLRAAPANLAQFLDGAGSIARIDETDGLQLHLTDGSMIHLRPSGNAPEMRCYASAPDEARAQALLRFGLERIETFTVPGSGDRI